MSIFKETFPKFLRDQLEIRQQVISEGTNGRDGTSRVSTSQYANGEIINTEYSDNFIFGEDDLGTDYSKRQELFYTYTLNKQCVVRLSSAVDVVDEKVFSEETGVGSSPAKNYILEGGVKNHDIVGGAHRSGFVKNYDSDDTSNIDASDQFQGGYAYGDSNIRSDAADGYGIVPMPGITKVDVRTKSAYGSLREAKIEFKCHNRRQLEILEILYMRPGYTLLLEWGWNPYINNEKEQENWRYIEGFFDRNKKMEEIERLIKSQKELTGGNYDALIGYCKNFTYKLRPDGGYDCTTEIIAKGEVLTGLKGAGKEEIKTDDEGNIFSRPALEELLMEIASLADGAVTQNIPFQGGKYIAASLIDKLELQKPEDKTTRDPEGKLNLEIDPDKVGEDRLKPWIIADGPAGWQFSEYIGITQGDGDHTSRDGEINGLDNRNSTCWVRWDALVHLLNKYVIPHNVYDDEIVQLQTNYVKNISEDEVEISPLQYCDHIPYQLAGWIPKIKYPEDKIFGYKEDEVRRIDWNHTDLSINGEICILPHTMYASVFANKSAIHSDYLFRTTATKLAETIPTDKKITNQAFGDLMQDRTKKEFVVPGSSPEQRLRNAQYSIGGIYLGVEWMLSLFKDHYYDSQNTIKEDATLFGFLEKIWDNVNKITGGNHDFTLQTDNTPQGKIVRVIDLNTDEINLERDKIYTLKIQSLDSIVRDVSYNTTIPSALASTIAISAQAPDSADALDQVSFAALNKGIRDRFSSRYERTKEELLFGENNEDKQEVLAQWDREFDLNLSRVWNALHIRTNSFTDTLDKQLEETNLYDVAAVSAIGGSVILGISGVLTGGTSLLLFAATAGIYAWIKGNQHQRIKKEEHGGLLRQMVYYCYNKLENSYVTTSGVTDMNMVETDDISKYSAALKELYKAIDYFSKVYGSTDSGGKYYKGQPFTGASRQTSSIIPIKFNAKMDGIGGLVIGNIFKIPKDRLPLAYNGDDIYFIVMGEEQNITNTNDWTTTITGHLILLGQSNRNTTGYREWYQSWQNADLEVDSSNLEEYYNKTNARGYFSPGNNYQYQATAGTYQNDDIPEGNLVSPLGDKKLHVNSPFGMRDLDGDGEYTQHRGVDLAAASGTPLYAVFSGKVVDTTGFTSGPSGGLVTLKLDVDKMNAGGGQTKPNRAAYCHMKQINVKVGDTVKKGQMIGLSGGDKGDKGVGRSTGAHLHFGLFVGSEAIPPMPWLPSN